MWLAVRKARPTITEGPSVSLGINNPLLVCALYLSDCDLLFSSKERETKTEK
jgi:acyl CoA:acetate/3-ketoacid CoA transferase beta subunit